MNPPTTNPGHTDHHSTHPTPSEPLDLSVSVPAPGEPDGMPGGDWVRVEFAAGSTQRLTVNAAGDWTAAAESGDCPAQHPVGYLCTLPVGHAGRHAAGTREMVAAMWSA